MRDTLFPLVATTAVQMLVTMSLVAVAVFAPAAAPDIGVPASLVGIFVALSYLGAMIGSLVSGTLVQRDGAIRISQACLVLCALGLACVAAGHPAMVVAGALLIGAGYGPVTPASSHVLARTTPPSMMSLVFSIKQTGVPLGGVAAGALVPPMVLWGGWRFAALAVAGACLASVALVQPLRREMDADRDPTLRLSMGSGLEALRSTMRDPGLKRLAMCSLCFAAIQLCLMTYLVTYLTQAVGYTLVAAGLMLAVAQVGGVVARVGWGAIADRWGRPMRVLAIIGFGMGVGAVGASTFTPSMPVAWVGVVCVVFGATAIGWNGVYLAQVARLAPAGQASLATAGSLFFTYAGVLVGPPVFAMLVGMGVGYPAAFVVMAVPAVGCAIWLLARDR